MYFQPYFQTIVCLAKQDISNNNFVQVYITRKFRVPTASSFYLIFDGLEAIQFLTIITLFLTLPSTITHPILTYFLS